eukprot:TRINITY_DN3553_c1_g1_i1.p2 TRINITY_DN3553_c1_g1~~TRINITY_DN3553_c1_g1_i1.p2  ORF type:complete len:411 (+),score=187.11 TRINITY_DN3553_c1_g1_i1:83-1315(+)
MSPSQLPAAFLATQPASAASALLCNDCGLEVMSHTYCSRTGLLHSVRKEDAGRPQQEQQPQQKGPLKTRLCRHFERGYCRYADSCGFAHGSAELRQRGGQSNKAQSPTAQTPEKKPEPPQQPQQQQQPQPQPQPQVQPQMQMPQQQLLPPPSLAAMSCMLAGLPLMPPLAAAAGLHPLSLAAGLCPPATPPVPVADGTQSQGSRASDSGKDAEAPEPAVDATKLKTRLCRHFDRGYCRFGDKCGFAHGSVELRKSSGSVSDSPQRSSSGSPSHSDDECDVADQTEMFFITKGPGGRIGATLLGTLVTKVQPDGPFAQAGVRPGTRIVAINGAQVDSFDALKTALAAAGESFLASFTERPASPGSDSQSETTLGHDSECESADLTTKRRDSADGLLLVQQSPPRSAAMPAF